jgi:hypothetical protein
VGKGEGSVGAGGIHPGIIPALSSRALSACQLGLRHWRRISLRKSVSVAQMRSRKPGRERLKRVGKHRHHPA